MLSLLTAAGARPDRLRRLIARIVALPGLQRADAIAKLAVVAGLRNLADRIKEEVPMSLAAELRENPFFRDIYREGLDKGRVEGRLEGRLEGERLALRKILACAAFDCPLALHEFIGRADAAELERMLDVVLRARSLEEFVSLADLPTALRGS